MILRGTYALLGVCLLSACTSYAPQALPTGVNLPASAAAVPIQAAQLPFRQLTTHIYNPADGLDSDEVAMLAVANNPQLRATRDALGLARAQAFSAGLLPDPQLNYGADHPTNYVPGGAVNSYGAVLTYDINALLLRSSRKQAAEYDVQRVNNELLWQEWQVVSQARLLFVRLLAQDEQLRTLQASQSLLADRYRASRVALAQGNVTADFAASDLLASQVVERQYRDLQRSRLQNRAALNALLGLAESAEPRLVGDAPPVSLDIAALRTDIPQLLQQRPDMRALQAGYQSQEEKFRGAVLAQFPALNVGLTRARDNTGIDSMGFAISLSLPVFNRNRGNIAIAQASRKQLYDEYQMRLNSAYGEITLALQNIPLLQAQLERIQQGAADLQGVAQHADAAFQAGNLTAPDYVRIQTAVLDKRNETINLTESLAEQRIALETLLGPDLPERSKL